jgi:hypothetical protein
MLIGIFDLLNPVQSQLSLWFLAFQQFFQLPPQNLTTRTLRDLIQLMPRGNYAGPWRRRFPACKSPLQKQTKPIE